MLLQAMMRGDRGGNRRGQVRGWPTYRVVYQLRMLLDESGIEFRGAKLRGLENFLVVRMVVFTPCTPMSRSARLARAIACCQVSARW